MFIAIIFVTITLDYRLYTTRMQTNPKISFSASTRAFTAVKKWLREEDQESGTGFYCNIEIIESSFRKKNFLSICESNSPVGFVVWSSYYCIATIGIMEIHPAHRNKGYARTLVTQLLSLLREKDIVAADLQCSPESSEPFWRKMNFIDFPDCRNGRWNKSNMPLYRIITPHCSADPEVQSHERIELWNDEPHYTENSTPTWTWSVNYTEDRRTLTTPIIHPCQSDWRIRWMRNDKIVKDDKVKYFSKKAEYDVGGFLVIMELE